MDYSRVAHLYDAYAGTQFDIPFFLKEAEVASQVLELMSGTGRLSIPLIQAGVRLTCVDNCPDMLAILRAKLADKALSGRVHEMDVCNLSLTETYDLIILPFHSFAEIFPRNDQRRALAGIRRLLAEGGRFICTLHNPPVRLRSVNGELVQLGKHPLPDGKGTLSLSAVEHYDVANHIVKGTQFYEVYDTDGTACFKDSVDVQFYLHEKDEFQELVQSEGLDTLNLHGDYSHSAFDENNSAFMIWILGKENAEQSGIADANGRRPLTSGF
ncbi:MAG: class I SAM-dependent methyltransferase [Phycisphaerales bacterium]|nr:MAG: class I SAM-dependent methyltransferase [Phycisphaerales bacterium]